MLNEHETDNSLSKALEASLNEYERSKSRIQQTMQNIYSDKAETGDVYFIVESEKICAHKNVLAAVSPKYKAQFYGLRPDEGDIIVKDITAAAFKEFLKFFYLGKANLTTDNIEDILSLARQSIVDDLIDDCISFLMKDVDNLCFSFRLAILYDMKELIDHFSLYVSKYPAKVFKSDDFLINCNREMLLQILKLDTLNCEESETFEACMAWAKAICKSKNLDAENMKNVRTELGDVLYEIRFNAMTIEEFVHLHNMYEGLLEPDEMKEIMYVIGNLKDFVPNKFNRKLRKKELELNRIVHEDARENWLANIIPVAFSCSKRIRLNGFASGFELLHNRYDLQVVLTDKNEIRSEHKPKYRIISKSEKETIVRLENPIEIEPMSIVAMKLELPCFEISTKYTLSKNIELANCYFTFTSQEGAPGILLTRLFFDKI